MLKNVDNILVSDEFKFQTSIGRLHRTRWREESSHYLYQNRVDPARYCSQLIVFKLNFDSKVICAQNCPEYFL